MRHSLRVNLVFFVALFSVFTIAPRASATPFTVTYSGTLACVTCITDEFGLDGATLTFTTVFDTTDVYTEIFTIPAVAALSNSLTVSGASVSSTNGTASAPTGVLFFPTFNGQFFSGSGGFLNYATGVAQLQILNLIQRVDGVNVGDPIDLNDFGTSVASLTSSQIVAGANEQYSVQNLQFSSTLLPDNAVPEPTTLLLLGTGIATAALRRRRR